MNRREAQAEVGRPSQKAEEIRLGLERALSDGGSLEEWLGGQSRDLLAESGHPCLDEDLICAAHICWRVLKLNVWFQICSHSSSSMSLKSQPESRLSPVGRREAQLHVMRMVERDGLAQSFEILAL